MITKTITTLFMVPSLKVPKGLLKDNGFINGFIDDKDKIDKLHNSIYLVFKPENIESFKNFLDDEYDRAINIIEDYDYEDGYVVVVYSLNHKFEKDFELIKQSKYSKTSKEFQELFPKEIDLFIENKTVTVKTLQFKIFNKDPELLTYWSNILNINLKNIIKTDVELWEEFNENRENLTKENKLWK